MRRRMPWAPSWRNTGHIVSSMMLCVLFALEHHATYVLAAGNTAIAAKVHWFLTHALEAQVWWWMTDCLHLRPDRDVLGCSLSPPSAPSTVDPFAHDNCPQRASAHWLTTDPTKPTTHIQRACVVLGTIFTRRRRHPPSSWHEHEHGERVVFANVASGCG